MTHVHRLQGIVALAAIVSAAPAALAGDDDLTLAELPDPVRRTVESETANATIVDIERDDGVETLYEIEFVTDGEKYELDVAADGTLLRRHRD